LPNHTNSSDVHQKIGCTSETHKSLKETDSTIIETLEVVITCEKPENDQSDSHSYSKQNSSSDYGYQNSTYGNWTN
jgi:hypothetical protein